MINNLYNTIIKNLDNILRYFQIIIIVILIILNLRSYFEINPIFKKTDNQNVYDTEANNINNLLLDKYNYKKRKSLLILLFNISLLSALYIINKNYNLEKLIYTTIFIIISNLLLKYSLFNDSNSHYDVENINFKNENIMAPMVFLYDPYLTPEENKSMSSMTSGKKSSKIDQINKDKYMIGCPMRTKFNGRYNVKNITYNDCGDNSLGLGDITVNEEYKKSLLFSNNKVNFTCPWDDEKSAYKCNNKFLGDDKLENLNKSYYINRSVLKTPEIQTNCFNLSNGQQRKECIKNITNNLIYTYPSKSPFEGYDYTAFEFIPEK